MEGFSFLNLRVYKEAKQLVVDVYQLLEKFPHEEKYAVCDQLRRAVASVPSNIAEGSGRLSPKEKVRFIEIAYGSLMETVCQLDIACDLNYINKEELDKEIDKIGIIGKQLSGLRTSFMKKAEEQGIAPR